MLLKSLRGLGREKQTARLAETERVRTRSAKRIEVDAL